MKVLDALGLGAEVAAVGGHMERMGYRDQHGATLCDFSLDPLVERVGEHPYPVRRSDLQALLLDAVGEGDARASGSAASAVDDAATAVAVHLESGERVEADLVVAADGTHSRLRDARGRPRRRSGSTSATTTGTGWSPTSSALGDPTSWTMHVGDGRRVSTMPVRDGQYFFFDVPLDDPTLDRRRPAGRAARALRRLGPRRCSD